MKNILGVYSNPNQHWVGNGFPVRSLFSYNDLGKPLASPVIKIYSPFVADGRNQTPPKKQ